jgi:DNA-binding Xre family transcriptional regulator
MVDGDGRTLNDRVVAGVRAELARSGMSPATLARRIGISERTMQRRLDGTTSFTVDEVDEICQVFEIQPAELIRTALALKSVRIVAEEVTVERR